MLGTTDRDEAASPPEHRGKLARILLPQRADVPPITTWGPWWAGLLVLTGFLLLTVVGNRWFVTSPQALVVHELIIAVPLFLLWVAGQDHAADRPGRLPFDWRWIRNGAIAVVAATIPANLILRAISTQYWRTDSIPKGGTDRLWMFVTMVLLAPVVEEVVFRGWLMRSLATKLPIVAAVLISGAIFGATHIWLAKYSPAEAGGIMVAGFVLGYLLVHNGSMVADIAGHMALNTVAFLGTVGPKAVGILPILLLLAGVVMTVRWAVGKPAPATVPAPVPQPVR